MRRRKYQVKKERSIFQHLEQNSNHSQSQDQQPIDRQKIRTHISQASQLRLLKKKSLSQHPLTMPGPSFRPSQQQLEFPQLDQKLESQEPEQPSCIVKMSALMKVLYKSSLYRIIMIFVHTVYMFGVLIELPDQVCQMDDSQKFRCDLSYYIQAVCICLIMPLFSIKMLRLVGIDSFKCVIELITFASGILCITGPHIILKYVKALRCLRLLLIVRQTNLIVPAYNMLASLKSIKNVLCPAILFVYIYAIIGLYSFSDNQYSRCRDPSVLEMKRDWTVYEQALYLCGQRSCPLANGVQYQCLNPIHYNVEPNPAQFEHIQFGNGLLKYSNIFNAFLTTYKQTLITGSSRIILLEKQVMNFIFVLIYYYSFIYLLQLYFKHRSYIYLNILYGLMIVNRTNHISTKEEYEALADQNNEYKVSQVQKKLMIRYQKVFKKIRKNMSLFPSTFTYQENKSLIYKTRNKISDASLIVSKRSGYNLDRNALMSAAVEHEVTREIINIVELNIENGSQIKNQLNSCSTKFSLFIKTFYYYFNIAIVILGCINVCLEHSGQSAAWEETINLLDLLFFSLYFLDFFGRYFILVYNMDDSKGELVVKIPKRIYLDGLILSISMTGYLYEILISEDFVDFYLAKSKIQKTFRAILYLRVLVVLSFEPYFAQSRKLFQFAWQAVKKSANFMLLWLLVLIMFSLMGYFLFGTCNTTDGCYKAQHYEASYQGIFEAIITTAVIMYNQDWDYIMYEQFPEHNYFIVVWNLIIITFGLLIISKYFMTYLLSELDNRINNNFDKENEEKVQQKSFLNKLLKEAISDQKQTSSQQSDTQNQNILQNEIIHPDIFQKKESVNFPAPKTLIRQGKTSQKKVNFKINTVTPDNDNNSDKYQPIRKRKLQLKRRKERRVQINELTIKQSSQLTQKPLNRNTLENDEIADSIGLPSQKASLMKKQSLKCDKQIYAQKDNPFQQPLVNSYPKSKPYIIIKSIAIAIVIFNFIHYLPQKDPNDRIKKISYYSAVFVDCFFIVDMIAQLYVYGIVKFFKKTNVSRFIDILLNIISILYFTPLGSNYIVKRLYSLRCLRISYWISLRCEKSQSMRVTVKGFIQLVPKILNLFFVICLIYGFFANIIVRVYKDDMWECINYEKSVEIITKQDCFNYGGDWVQENMNASNFGNALLYIFLLSSTEDWLNTMNYLSTIQGKDLQPQYTNSSILRICFLIFMFFANIIVMNIFVGVCINNFKQIKKRVTGETDLSKEEKQWLNIKNQIYLLEPQPMDQQPSSDFRKFFFRLAKSKQITAFKFLQLIGLLTLLSFITTNMSQENKNKIIVGQYIFTSCSFLVFVVDMIATSTKNHNRTIRIFQIVLYSYALIYGVTLIVLDLPSSVQKICGGILVTLQLGRYFLFIQQFEFFQKMFNSLLTILPKTKDIFLLMLITLFIYTSIGMEIFGYLKPGQELNDFDENYVDFGSALFSLIKFSTWQEPIQQIRDGIQQISSSSVCFDVHDYTSFITYGQNGCGNTGQALTFFLSFHIIYSLILMPTLMGIIFDSYNEVYIDQSACINKFQLIKVKEQWKKFDPQGTGYISYRDFWVLTSKIIKIYKFTHNKLLNNQTRQNFLKQLNISIYQSPEGILCFEFHELIQALTRSILVRKQKNPIRKDFFNKQVTYIHEVNKKSEILHKLKKSSYDSSHVLTLILLKSGLKSWRNKTDDKMKATLFQTIEMKNKMKSEKTT